MGRACSDAAESNTFGYEKNCQRCNLINLEAGLPISTKQPAVCYDLRGFLFFVLFVICNAVG
ncbi:hypothetical protein LguiB_020048 [Lonicera macranthoides]